MSSCIFKHLLKQLWTLLCFAMYTRYSYCPEALFLFFKRGAHGWHALGCPCSNNRGLNMPAGVWRDRENSQEKFNMSGKVPIKNLICLEKKIIQLSNQSKYVQGVHHKKHTTAILCQIFMSYPVTGRIHLSM